MASSEFDSAWLKAGWAYRHAQSLQADVAAHARTNPAVGVRPEYDGKLHAFVLRVEEIVPPPIAWGLRLGDFINCQRSALDHVAWALVMRGTTPNLSENKLRSVYFPISTDRTKFKAAVPKTLPGVRRADLAVVRRHQPYQAGRKNVVSDCLVTLASLVTADKHRQVQPVWSLPETVECRFGLHDCFLNRVVFFHDRPLKLNAELGRIYVRQSGRDDPRVEVDGQFATKPALDNGLWLEDFLNQTNWFVWRLLAKFAEPPEQLFSLGIKGIARVR